MEREQKRLQDFRRLRQEIRGSQDYLVVGIDISKDRHDASPYPSVSLSCARPAQAIQADEIFRLGLPLAL